MVPGLEHDVSGNGSRCSKNRYVAPRAITASRQASTASLAAVWNAKASRLSVTRTEARVSLPCPKLCSRLYPLLLSTLKVLFSIFQRARPGGDFRDIAGCDRQIGDDAVI